MLFSAMLRKFEILCNADHQKDGKLFKLFRNIHWNWIKFKWKKNATEKKSIETKMKNSEKLLFFFDHLTIAAEEKSLKGNKRFSRTNAHALNVMRTKVGDLYGIDIIKLIVDRLLCVIYCFVALFSLFCSFFGAVFLVCVM